VTFPYDSSLRIMQLYFQTKQGTSRVLNWTENEISKMEARDRWPRNGSGNKNLRRQLRENEKNRSWSHCNSFTERMKSD